MTRRKSEADQQQGGLAARERLDHCERRESYCYPRPFGKKKKKSLTEILNRWTEFAECYLVRKFHCTSLHCTTLYRGDITVLTTITFKLVSRVPTATITQPGSLITPGMGVLTVCVILARSSHFASWCSCNHGFRSRVLIIDDMF